MTMTVKKSHLKNEKREEKRNTSDQMNTNNRCTLIKKEMYKLLDLFYVNLIKNMIYSWLDSLVQASFWMLRYDLLR